MELCEGWTPGGSSEKSPAVGREDEKRNEEKKLGEMALCTHSRVFPRSRARV